MKIVLVGYMGSGKSNVGQSLSKVLNYPWVDLDDYISKKLKMSIPQIFDDKGEIYFRKEEAKSLAKILSSRSSLVLALGGGTPCYGNVMSYLRDSEDTLTVYLKCNLETLTNRLFLERKSRPLIAHLASIELLNDFIRKHLFERSYYYNQADLVLNCDDKSVREIVEELVLKLI